LSTATLLLFTMGPEIALRSDSEIDAYDLRLVVSFCLIEQPLCCEGLDVTRLCLDLLFSQIGKWRSAASSANTRLQVGHYFFISYLRCCLGSS